MIGSYTREAAVKVYLPTIVSEVGHCTIVHNIIMQQLNYCLTLTLVLSLHKLY